MTRYYDDKLKCWVTVCPPGAALGAGDLRNWATRRASGMAGSDGRAELKREKNWKLGGPFRRRRFARALRGGE